MGSGKEKDKNTHEKVVLRIEDLQLSFGEKEVLKGFELELREGENIAVMGRSGSGKSVSIKCVVGLLKPDDGKIEVLEKDISTLDQHEMDDLRAELGYLFQGSALYDSMTVRENLEFPLRRHKSKFDLEQMDKMVKNTLEQVGMEEAIDQMPEELSGGMQRRVALARALIMKPRILFYDEPTAGLDPITAREIGELMKKIRKENNTASVLITHDVGFVKRTTDRIILLIEGKNYAEGTFDELSNSEDPKVNEFFK